ncbi:carbohydrate ABC transporter permease [Natronospirillum operosum]|uniref:Maltose/maltodextrin transport system permease protein MalG n=1 Tax=Natronospirillum operosum TaxID=2759953 RepID=A0A4Z0W6T3_9GAMM|nr:carbohydrate ABC transporter permease [Natronospirillum operosum]TGG93544.1 carbohydrate ABC transporter permease [Natronospirillum operosum]
MRNNAFSSRQIGLSLAALAIVVVYALPYIYLVSTSLKPASQVLQIPPSFWPQTVTLENYTRILGTATVPGSFANSVIVALTSTFLALVLAVPAAYGASFFRVRLSIYFMMFALITRMVPTVSLGVPLFTILKDVGLLDTHLGLILAHTTISLPLAVWLMSAFFESIPRELEEAARMDGCNRFQSFFLVVLPLVSSGMAIAALFCFIASWNEFLFALLLTADQAKTTPIVIAEFRTAYGLDWGPMTALATLYSLPVILITLLLQKQIIGGLTFGAVKG